MEITVLGAAGEVTGSSYLVRAGGYRFLLECGLRQGGHREEQSNRADFPFDPSSLDAVILSHAHIDHSGRIPLLVERGFSGPVYTQSATRDLCRIMLRDAGFLNEKEAQWENRKRLRKGLAAIRPLYSMADADRAMASFVGLPYGRKRELLPGVWLRFSDAGHILGSAIVELWLHEGPVRRKVVFSGDLGHRGAPILRDPTTIDRADLVIMESTYGDRLHRSWDETLDEIGELLTSFRAQKGNLLIPAFAVGRSQEILYLFARNFDRWRLDQWGVFLDSPMAIQATSVYRKHGKLYDEEARELWGTTAQRRLLPNLYFTRTTQQSMRLNDIRSGALIIAASGMCTGGRIRHHLKNNIWRKECQVMIVGFQARGTIGRALVDGARHIRLWGETIRVAAAVHTVGGLSAHADRRGLLDWYASFDRRPPVVLVHGEPGAAEALRDGLREDSNSTAVIARYGQVFDLEKGVN